MNNQIELNFAKELAYKAGKMTLLNFGLNTEAVWKADVTPLTKTDIAINKLVIDEIQAAFPKDGVLGEEASFEPERSRLWVVDPIDGTQPFVLGAPLSTFCIALVENNQPILGVVYDPYLNRLYWGAKGEGAFINGKPLTPSVSAQLANNFVILSSRMGKSRTTGSLYDAIELLQGKSFNFRSIVYGLMMVATGSAVAAVAGYLKPWDLAAAKVILEEVGAKVTDFEGNPCNYDENSNGCLVSNSLVHNQMLKLINT